MLRTIMYPPKAHKSSHAASLHHNVPLRPHLPKLARFMLVAGKPQLGHRLVSAPAPDDPLPLRCRRAPDRKLCRNKVGQPTQAGGAVAVETRCWCLLRPPSVAAGCRGVCRTADAAHRPSHSELAVLNRSRKQNKRLPARPSTRVPPCRAQRERASGAHADTAAAPNVAQPSTSLYGGGRRGLFGAVLGRAHRRAAPRLQHRAWPDLFVPPVCGSPPGETAYVLLAAFPLRLYVELLFSPRLRHTCPSCLRQGY